MISCIKDKEVRHVSQPLNKHQLSIREDDKSSLDDARLISEKQSNKASYVTMINCKQP